MKRLLFLKRFFHLPSTIGSITPSTQYLANKMVEGIPWDDSRTIVELGAGTGVITEAIMKSMSPNTTLILFEKDPLFRHLLLTKYPHAMVVQEAKKLQYTLHAQNIKKADLIFSSLPFTVLKKKERDQILNNVYESLDHGGRFIAYQYSLRMRTEFASYFPDNKIKFVPLNIPPAFIFHCQKH
jgi:phospholipid N-methyltransferase